MLSFFFCNWPGLCFIGHHQLDWTTQKRTQSQLCCRCVLQRSSASQWAQSTKGRTRSLYKYQQGNTNQYSRECLILNGRFSVCSTGSSSAKAAERSGLPVLPPASVWASGEGNPVLQKDNRIQGTKTHRGQCSGTFLSDSVFWDASLFNCVCLSRFHVTPTSPTRLRSKRKSRRRSTRLKLSLRKNWRKRRIFCSRYRSFSLTSADLSPWNLNVWRNAT